MHSSNLHFHIVSSFLQQSFPIVSPVSSLPWYPAQATPLSALKAFLKIPDDLLFLSCSFSSIFQLNIKMLIQSHDSVKV
jgi:hypothetical protein